MSPSRDTQAATGKQFGDLKLSIIGMGTEYPPFDHESDWMDILCERYYPDSPAMTKVRMINKYTGIDTRSAIGTVDHPIANMDRAPTIAELCEVFLKEGVALAVTASRKALHEAQLSPLDITHVVSTTCTNSANPGFDHYVCKQLGITQPVEKVLLAGIGCSGGLASLRTAANLALGASFMGRKARVLVVAAEISSIMVRSELDSIHELQETRIGVTLFSDCASAVVLSNGIGGEGQAEGDAVYDLLGWDHRLIPDTEMDLGFDVDPLGWKVVLSLRVPKLTAAVVPTTFSALLSSLPTLPSNYIQPCDFDWALHPGGSTILTGVEKAMEITPEHMRASYDTYINHGNSSSATIFSVMDRMRMKEMDELAPEGRVREYVVGCAFGPGIAIEMCLLKRNLGHVRRTMPMAMGGGVGNGNGVVTPPLTESEPSDGGRSDGEGEEEVEREGKMEGDNDLRGQLEGAVQNNKEGDKVGGAKVGSDTELRRQLEEAMKNNIDEGGKKGEGKMELNTDLQKRLEDLKGETNELSSKLEAVHPEVPEQGEMNSVPGTKGEESISNIVPTVLVQEEPEQDSLAEALNGVELD